MTPQPKRYFPNKVSGNIIGCLSFRDDIKYASRVYVLRIRTDIWAKIMYIPCMHVTVHRKERQHKKSILLSCVHDETNL